MTDQEYKNMIHSIVVPAGTVTEEQRKRYKPLIDFLRKETPEKLYRFRKCNELNIDAFDQDKLFFSSGNKMNDDFDSLLYFNKNRIISEANKNIKIFLNLCKQDKKLPPYIQEMFSSKIQQMMPKTFFGNFNDNVNPFLDFLDNKINTNLDQINQIVQTTVKFASFSEKIESAAM